MDSTFSYILMLYMWWEQLEVAIVARDSILECADFIIKDVNGEAWWVALRWVTMALYAAI